MFFLSVAVRLSSVDTSCQCVRRLMASSLWLAYHLFVSWTNFLITEASYDGWSRRMECDDASQVERHHVKYDRSCMCVGSFSAAVFDTNNSRSNDRHCYPKFLNEWIKKNPFRKSLFRRERDSWKSKESLHGDKIKWKGLWWAWNNVIAWWHRMVSLSFCFVSSFEYR